MFFGLAYNFVQIVWRPLYRQIMAFYDKVGGFGHLALVGRSGCMTHEESSKSIRLFTREVLPRLREIGPVEVG